MTQLRDLIDVADPVTDDELDSALLDMTGDLDKARVLRDTLPRWLVGAKSATLSALEQAHGESENVRRRLEEQLSRLLPLDRFCADRLHTFLTRKGHLGLDVLHDRLELPVRTQVSVAPILTGVLIEQGSLEILSLVQAAMQNFSSAQAEPGGLPDATLIRSAASKTVATGITLAQFVDYCRTLDLGGTYQAHLREVFNLKPPGKASTGLSFNQAAVDIGQAKCLDMKIDLHIAYAKGHISEATYAWLTKLIRADRPAIDVDYLAPVGRRLIWQGLNLDGACLWSVMILSDDTPGQPTTDTCVIYMPNEPVRPWFEYTSLGDFKQYLTLKLQVPAYRRFFAGYLDVSERVGFFQRFDKGRALGALKMLAVHSNFSEFFFRAYVGKVQLDAQLVAVPVAQVDDEARRERLLAYLDAGLDIFNVAAFVVPGLGQLMFGVAIGQILGEVFEGVEDWNHHDRAEALNHLVNVAENIAAMALFAAGGRVVGSLKRTSAPSTEFFDKTEAVTLADHRPRLWRPRLTPYRQPTDLEAGRMANIKGVYQANGRSYIVLDGALYAITFDPGIGRWRIDHPVRSTAYRPPLEHNYQGGWQHVFERPQDWQYPLYNLQRIDPSLVQLPPEAVRNLSAVTEMEAAELQRLAMEHEPLPERFHDGVAHYKQYQKTADLLHYLERDLPPDASTARTQMLALALIPTWPEGRFFELLDSEGYLLESHPNLAPFDYEDLSIHITEQQLKDGQVMSTLLAALSEEERTALLGAHVEPHQAQPLLARRLFTAVNEHRRELCQKLYENSSSSTRGDLVPLSTRYPQMPANVAWELVASATSRERAAMRTTRRIPLLLAQRSRAALEQLEEDRAVMGLYWPPLAGESSQRVAVGMLAHLPQWPKDLLLHVREGGLKGRVLAETGAPTATVRRSVIKTGHIYQAFDERGHDLNTLTTGSEGLYQALIDCLSPTQRKAMSLDGDAAASRLRNQLLFKTQDERRYVARYLRPERRVMEPPPSTCPRAQAAEPAPFAAALVRKVKKLYPGFSELDVSGLLQACGTDHLSRAKAVEVLEQHYKVLKRTLKLWCSDRSGYDAQAEPLWDRRLSRSQAMKAILRSWRKLFLLRGPDGFEVPGLALDGMLLGRLPNLAAHVRFDHVRKLSLNSMALTDDVAYFLKHFTGVRSLELSHNRLSRLPEVLTHMPELEHLYLDGNQLQLTEYTRKKLAGLRHLKTLSLSENPLLDPPDVTQMFELRELLLRNCRLRDFPVGARRLPYLVHIDLRENDVKDLPDWLFKMPRRYTETVNLRHNPLGANARMALHNYRRNAGVGMGYLEDDIGRLNEQKARELWLADERVTGFAERLFTWKGLKDEPGVDGLFKLLAELGNTADAVQVREDLDRRVWRVLDATAADAELRENVFDRAGTPMNCDDAAAANFSSLEILVEISDARRLIEGQRLTAGPLLKLGRGLFRLEQLERIARRHSDEHPASDPLEVSLAYRTGLVDRFHLPGQPRHMRFARLGGVTPQALNSAEAELRAAEMSTELMKYLTSMPFWADYLKRTFASRFESLMAPYERRVHAVFEQALTLEDGDYRDRMNLILHEQRQAEMAELERLTRDALKVEELGICATPEH